MIMKLILQKMLHLHPSQRITAYNALNHPYFQDNESINNFHK